MYHRNQRHVRIGCHRDSTYILRTQFICNRNGGRTVSSADNCDREEIPEIGEEHTCHAQSKENAKLRSCAKEHQLGVGQQRAKIDHGADTDEQQQGEQFVCNTCMVQLLNRAYQSVGERNVYKNGAKAHRQQQGRLHLLGNCQIHQQAADADHNQVIPVKGQ